MLRQAWPSFVCFLVFAGASKARISRLCSARGTLIVPKSALLWAHSDRATLSTVMIRVLPKQPWHTLLLHRQIGFEAHRHRERIRQLLVLDARPSTESCSVHERMLSCRQLWRLPWQQESRQVLFRLRGFRSPKIKSIALGNAQYSTRICSSRRFRACHANCPTGALFLNSESSSLFCLIGVLNFS